MKGAATPSSAADDVRSGATAVRRVAAATFADVIRLLPAARRRAVAARDHARAALAALRMRWSRSLQLRVVGTTLIFSAAVIAALGFFLLQQIAGGLLQNKERSAAALVETGVSVMENAPGFSTTPPTSANANALMAEIIDQLPGESSAGNATGTAIMINKFRSKNAYALGSFKSQYRRASIPQALIALVNHEQLTRDDQQAFEPTLLVSADGRQRVPGIVIGTPVGSDYQLYYLFPLTQEQQTLALVQRTIIVVGLALVFLLAAIASLVTRWVVVPVRQAAQGARRLSTGNLSERVEVRGADDLAALATSFNDMAASLQEKMAELQELSHVQRPFVSDVSHELRTPLTTISIAADVLFAAKQQLDASSGRSAELLQSQLERFEALLADLLEISRYDANAATLETEPVDIRDLVLRAVADSQQIAGRCGSRVELLMPGEPCIADVDGRRVERVLRNLIVNAAEHGEGKDVLISAAADRYAVAIAVRDFGVGLK